MFLKDGARLVGAKSELAGDFARQAVTATAQKVFRGAGKKFSRVTFRVLDREVSVWDFYCYNCFRNGSSYRDKLIADFIHFHLARWVEDMSQEMRWLIEMSACNSAHVEEDELLSREIVTAVIQAEINLLAAEYGRSVQEQYGREAVTSLPRDRERCIAAIVRTPADCLHGRDQSSVSTE
jgi:hypothetical protein